MPGPSPPEVPGFVLIWEPTVTEPVETEAAEATADEATEVEEAAETADDSD